MPPQGWKSRPPDGTFLARDRWLWDFYDEDAEKRADNMSYLMLELEQIDVAPEHGATVEFRVMDSRRGTVTEIAATIRGPARERSPSYLEMQIASQVIEGMRIYQEGGIRQGVDSRVADEKIRLLLSDLEEARVRMHIQSRSIDQLTEENRSLSDANEALQRAQIDPEDMKMIATALEIRIEELAMTNQIAEYAKVKRTYEQVLGRSWVEDI